MLDNLEQSCKLHFPRKSIVYDWIDYEYAKVQTDCVAVSCNFSMNGCN